MSILDKHITMTCSKCGREEDSTHLILFSMIEMYGGSWSGSTCPEDEGQHDWFRKPDPEQYASGREQKMPRFQYYIRANTYEIKADTIEEAEKIAWERILKSAQAKALDVSVYEYEPRQ